MCHVHQVRASNAASDLSIAEAVCSAGQQSLAISLGSIASGAGPEHSTFWANLKLHLTDLTLQTPENSKASHLEILNTLTALQRLQLWWYPVDFQQKLSEEKLALKLPHLVNLRMDRLEQAELVLSCPKLAKAWFTLAKSSRIEVNDAALEDIRIDECNRVQLAMKDQLQNLTDLDVFRSLEVDRLLIEDVGLMTRLRWLWYESFPAACMPSTFPESLQYIVLAPVNWCHNLPGGLKELHQLIPFTFLTPCNMTRPLAEFLPMDTLEYLQLHKRKYYLRSTTR